MNHHQDLPEITGYHGGFIHFGYVTIRADIVDRCYDEKVNDYYAAHPNIEYVPNDISLEFYDEAMYEVYWDTVTERKNELYRIYEDH
jgi:hypothetical protein